jgi:hypothetical protein
LKLQGHEANLSTLVLYNDGTNNLWLIFQEINC